MCWVELLRNSMRDIEPMHGVEQMGYSSGAGWLLFIGQSTRHLLGAEISVFLGVSGS
jgi:hypothetical protein